MKIPIAIFFQIMIDIVFAIAISMALIFHATLYLLPAVFILASFLIDEARTPLVLAGANELESHDTVIVNKAVNMLTQCDITFDTNKSEIWLTESGIGRIETILQIENLYDKQNAQILSLLYGALEDRAIPVKVNFTLA